MNAKIPHEGMSLVEKHKITLERRQRIEKEMYKKIGLFINKVLCLK